MTEQPAHPPIELTFRYTQRDYVRALRAHYATRLNVPLDVAVAVVIAACGAYLWTDPDLRWLGIVSIVVAVLFLAMLMAAFLVIPPLVFRFDPKLHHEYSLRFAPDGIHFRTTGIDSHLEWKLYQRALVDARSYLLYHGARYFSVIPKRVFQSADQERAFEQLLTQHIPQIKRR